jgi:hypothetical protein
VFRPTLAGAGEEAPTARRTQCEHWRTHRAFVWQPNNHNFWTLFIYMLQKIQDRGQQTHEITTIAKCATPLNELRHPIAPERDAGVPLTRYRVSNSRTQTHLRVRAQATHGTPLFVTETCRKQTTKQQHLSY